jgi:GNAT superfamily N-acetyltransferase
MEYYISNDKTLLDVPLIHDFLSNRSYWGKGRTLETVETSITHSLCFGVFNKENQQVGFARVVTDYVLVAWLMDLFILEDYRGQGLSKLLMTAVMGHPDLQNMRRWGLGTADAHSLYEQFGFTPLSKPEAMMEKLSEKLF